MAIPTTNNRPPNTNSTADRQESRHRDPAWKVYEISGQEVRSWTTSNSYWEGRLAPPDSHISITANKQTPHVHSLFSALPDDQSPGNKLPYTWGTTLLHSCSAVKNLYFLCVRFQCLPCLLTISSWVSELFVTEDTALRAITPRTLKN